MRALIGVDVGTQGTKAALYEEDGTLLATAFRKSTLHQSAAGIVEEDPEKQVASVCQTIAECVKKSRIGVSSLAAIAIDGQMAGLLGVGHDGKHVTAYDSWLDTRCSPYISRMEKTAGAQVLARTGGPVSVNHGPKILWWMHERPAVFRSIKAFVQPGSYAAMRLCGADAGQAFIDKTYLHFSGFADNRAGCWDAELCRLFGLDQAKLPRIVGSTDVVGELTGSMARRCGVRAGVPIVAGCGDTAASFLACGATREGICIDVAGSASVFAAVTGTFKPDRKNKILSCGQAATPRLWHPYAYINGGGLNLEWFRGLFGDSTKTLPNLAALDRRAEGLLPAAEDPFFIPHLSGRVAPACPRLRGAWANLNRTHRLPHLWRAMLESVALEYAIYRKAVLSLHPTLRPTELRVTGGGERSRVWNQIKADVLGLKVVNCSRSEGAPTGAALLAACSIGVVNDLDSGARQWLATTHVTRPRRRLETHYDARLKRYERLLKELAVEGNHST